MGQTEDLEKSTRGQGHSKTWRETRLLHITSSNFGTICKATDRRDMDALTDGLTTHRDIRSKAILHGRKYEHVAVEKFEARWGIDTDPCGIFVSQTHPQLAASPDRIIDQDTVLEVKCPYASRDKIISPETVPYLKEADGALVLDPNHDYHYQIQGQLFCSNRKLCLFVVYTLRDIVMIRIERDEGFINTMLDKLLSFYKLHFEPAIINKFMYRNYHHYNFD